MKTGSTVYHENKNSPRVGLTINGTASLTLTELHLLIDHLQSLVKHAAHPTKYTKPKELNT